MTTSCIFLGVRVSLFTFSVFLDFFTLGEKILFKKSATINIQIIYFKCKKRKFLPVVS